MKKLIVTLSLIIIGSTSAMERSPGIEWAANTATALPAAAIKYTAASILPTGCCTLFPPLTPFIVPALAAYGAYKLGKGMFYDNAHTRLPNQ